MLKIIIYAALLVLLIYLVKFIVPNLINKTTYLKDKIYHDKKKQECFDYCPDFAGKPCGRPGCCM